MSFQNQTFVLFMDFPKRLANLRKEKGLTQQNLTDKARIHVMQIRRYEGGESQPTVEVIRKLSVALNVTADELIFDENERDPDKELQLHFEAISKFVPEEKKIARALLEALILRYEAKSWSSS